MRLVAGRLQPRLRVLRHRAAWGSAATCARDEIVDQALHAAELLAADGKVLTHVVFMGMGEPLLNLKNVVQAIRVPDPSRRVRARAATHHGVDRRGRAQDRASSARPCRCGSPSRSTPPRDELRDVLVPLNRRFPIAELLDACAAYPTPKRERISVRVHADRPA